MWFFTFLDPENHMNVCSRGPWRSSKPASHMTAVNTHSAVDLSSWVLKILKYKNLSPLLICTISSWRSLSNAQYKPWAHHLLCARLCGNIQTFSSIVLTALHTTVSCCYTISLTVLSKTNDIQFPQLLPVQDALPASDCLNGPPLPEYQQYCSSICNNREINTLLSVRANPCVISTYWDLYVNVSIGGSRKMDLCFPVQQASDVYTYHSTPASFYNL